MPIEVRLVNAGRDVVCVPSGFLLNDSLAITVLHDGQTVRAAGKLVNYAYFGANGFSCLRPAHFVGARIDLAPESDTGFQIMKPGLYTVRVTFETSERDLLEGAMRRGEGLPSCLYGASEHPGIGPSQLLNSHYWRGRLSGSVEIRIFWPTHE